MRTYINNINVFNTWDHALYCDICGIEYQATHTLKDCLIILSNRIKDIEVKNGNV